MTISVPGEAARRAAYERQQADREANAARLTARLLAAYDAEPDRDYAEEMWGSMLRERGVDIDGRKGARP